MSCSNTDIKSFTDSIYMLLVYKQGISVMVFSTDENTNKAVVYGGVPENGEKFKQLEVSEWLTAALEPLKGRCGKGKGGLAQGQVSHFLL